MPLTHISAYTYKIVYKQRGTCKGSKLKLSVSHRFVALPEIVRLFVLLSTQCGVNRQRSALVLFPETSSHLRFVACRWPARYQQTSPQNAQWQHHRSLNSRRGRHIVAMVTGRQRVVRVVTTDTHVARQPKDSTCGNQQEVDSLVHRRRLKCRKQQCISIHNTHASSRPPCTGPCGWIPTSRI